MLGVTLFWLSINAMSSSFVLHVACNHSVTSHTPPRVSYIIFGTGLQGLVLKLNEHFLLIHYMYNTTSSFIYLLHISLQSLRSLANTDSEYVILIALPLQQRLHESASLLCYMYIGCHVLFPQH